MRLSRTLCLAVAICATVATTALAVTPPAGTPDLSQMAIQAPDLAPGAQITTQGYVTPASGVVAEYDRQWHASGTASGVGLQDAGTTTLLLPSSAKAAALIAGERRVFANKAERKLLADLFSLGAHSKIKAKQIRFGRVRTVAAGDAGFVLPVTVDVAKHSYATDLFEVQVSDVVSEVIVLSRHAKAAAKGGDELVVDVAGHIRSVLAATGATGPSGPTGATS